MSLFRHDRYTEQVYCLLTGSLDPTCADYPPSYLWAVKSEEGEKRSFRLNNGVVRCVIAFLAAVLLKNAICADSRLRVKKYCRERDKAMTVSDEIEEYSNETDDYLLVVDAEINSTIVLENILQYELASGDESKVQPPRLWYWQDLNQTLEMTEVELGMDNNVTQIRVHMTAEYSLIIRTLLEEDIGIYRCIGDKDRENNRSLFNYRLEPVLDEESTNSTQQGNETEYKKYRELNLLPVTQLFAHKKALEMKIERSFKNSTDEELLAIRDEGVTLELVSEWGPWGPCEECVKKRGVRTRRAFCRIKSHINEVKPVPSESIISIKYNA
ncbi:hypothetical protein TSAR_001995 [Trichomalopsis sarcophagae]|uniref:Ig-like domain-containing protein n=1 Tax=Trichomalopsis sarcophagae TaxID=543379 RepID=A0A232EXQ2_9HYME|nr:hypothetical protein TSAR_001995 [Trichomalopsis sarcophagae]